MPLRRTTPLPLLALLAAGEAASAPGDPPVQCVLNALSAPERDRQRVLIGKLRAATRGRSELPKGYAIGVDPSRMSLAELAEWIGLESRCCPFLDFALEVSRGGAPVRLRITGGEGAKEFIAAEMSPSG